MKEDDQLKRIREILGKYNENLFSKSIPTPAEALIHMEELEDEEMEWDEIQRRAKRRKDDLSKIIHYFFQQGPNPLLVIRNVYAAAKAINPDLLKDMSMEDISIICADSGRCTVSARIKRIYNKKIEDAGGRPVLSSCQKTGNYSTPQLANSNRCKKHGRHAG